MDCVPLRRFDALGFVPAYACEVDPEFPGTGDWGCPHYGFHRDGPATEPFRSRWGAPLIVRVQPAGQERWVGSFEAGCDHDLTSVFACPNPTQALVVCGGQPYLVDVTAPARSTAIDLDPIIHVRRVGDLNLVVLATHLDLTAIGPAGLAWSSERLCLDGLRILDATADGIRCAGYGVAGYSVEEFTVDPHDGQVRTGPRFLDTWPGH
jgi:hypothetical protein